MALTEQDIREFMLDRSADDNEFLMDIAYSPEEIDRAMRAAAREYNSVPPPVHTVRANALPTTTNLFYYATAEQLMRSEVLRLARNDAAVQTGDVSDELDARRIQHFRSLIQEYRELWYNEALEKKRMINLRGAYGSYP